MSLLSDAYVNEHHHRHLNEAREKVHIYELPKQTAVQTGKVTKGWHFAGSLRQLRIQVTFEVVGTQLESNLECC